MSPGDRVFVGAEGRLRCFSKRARTEEVSYMSPF